MASFWGTSWGTAWGDSWGTMAAGADITVPVASVVVSPLAPSIQTGASVAVTAVDVTVAALAPSVTMGIEVVVPDAALVVAAVAPTIATGSTITVGAVAVTIAALVPTVTTPVEVQVPAAGMTVLALRPCVNGYWRTADETDVTADTTSLTADTTCSPFTNVGLLPAAVTIAAHAPEIVITPPVDIVVPSATILVFPRSPYIGELPDGIDHPEVASATRAYRVASATYEYTLRRAA